MVKKLIIFLLFLISCTKTTTSLYSSPNITVENKIIHLDNRLTSEQKQLIVDAALAWQFSIKNIVRFNFDYNEFYDEEIDVDSFDLATSNSNSQLNKKIYYHHHINDIVFITRLSKNEDIQEIEEINGYKLYGTTYVNDHKDIVILVQDRLLDPILFRKIVMHELGHILLDSTHDNNNSLMNTIGNKGSYCITKDDIKKFCSIYHCNYKELNACN